MPQVDRSLLPDRVNEYLNYLLNVKGSSALTVEGYARDLRLFLDFLADKKAPAEEERPTGAVRDLRFIDDAFLSAVALRDIYDFLTYCGSARANNLTTRQRKTSALRGFFRFISDNMGYIDHNPAANLEIAGSKTKLPRYLTLEQSVALLDAVEGEFAARDRCILTLFLNCGLRLAELCALNLSDLDLTERTMVVTGKGNKQRMLYLNDACVNAILDYLQVRPRDGLKADARSALFISRLHQRIGRQAVQLMVYRYLEKIGLDGQHYSVHKLRHTAATLLYQHANVDPLVLKEMLGHENLSTTQIYTHVDNKQVREAIDHNPLNTQKKEKKD